MQLCQEVYALSSLFPDGERFGLTAQVRRAAVSVPSNIAEGYGRRRKQDYIRFLDMAHASLCEVETQVVLAVKLGFIDEGSARACVNLADETGRVLYGLIRSLGEST